MAAIHSSRRLSPKCASHQTPAQTSPTPYYTPGDTLVCHADRYPEGKKNVTAHISYSEVKHLMLGKRTTQDPSQTGLASSTKQPLQFRRHLHCLQVYSQSGGASDNSWSRSGQHNPGPSAGAVCLGGNSRAQPLGQRQLNSCGAEKAKLLEEATARSTSKATCSFLSERNYCEGGTTAWCSEPIRPARVLQGESYSCTFGCADFCTHCHQRGSARD